MAENDAHALAIARRIVGNLNMPAPNAITGQPWAWQILRIRDTSAVLSG